MAAFLWRMPLFVYTMFREHAICAREGLQIEGVSDSFILLQKCYMNDFYTCLGDEITSDLQSGLIFAASKPTSSHSNSTPHEKDYIPCRSPQHSARFGPLCLHRTCTGCQVFAERREESQRDAQCGQCQRPARNSNRLALGRCQRARERTPRHLRNQPAQRQRQLAF